MACKMVFFRVRLAGRVSCEAELDYPCQRLAVCVPFCAFWLKGVKNGDRKVPARWFAAMAALLMVVSLVGVLIKRAISASVYRLPAEYGDASGERLPTLTADQKKNSLGLCL